MNVIEQTVAAVALYANGADADRIAAAIGTDPDTAQALIEAGAEAQAPGRIGYMHTSRYLDGADHAGL